MILVEQWQKIASAKTDLIKFMVNLADQYNLTPSERIEVLLTVTSSTNERLLKDDRLKEGMQE